MKTIAEYQKISRERLKAENGYKLAQFYITDKVSAKLAKIAAKKGVTKREVLNFIRLEGL